MSVCGTVLPSFRWAILTFLVWWTRFRPSILRTSDVWIGVVINSREGKALLSLFIFPFLVPSYLTSSELYFIHIGEHLAVFWAFYCRVKHRGAPLFSFVGRNVRTSSWLLWVPFNYSSSNWAVLFDLTDGFCGRKGPRSPRFFTDLWTLKERGHLSFCLTWVLDRFSLIERPGPGLIPSLAFPYRFLLEVMGDTSERSKAPSLPPRCPCGFWG